MSSEQRVACAVEGLTKSFPGTIAVDDLSFEVRAGHVHALIGENGAGKTTLLLMLSGVMAPDKGRILVAGEAVHFTSPRDAQLAGIGTVFQELSLVHELTVAENVFANRAPTGLLDVIDRRRMERQAGELLQILGSTVQPRDRVRDLGLGAQQEVEIAKALSLNATILLLDEPTSALSTAEVKTLFRVVARLKRQGMAIVFVSHRLGEVFEIADRITILRDGRLVGTYDRGAIDPDRAVRLMVGRPLSTLYPPRASEVGPLLLEVRGLQTGRVGPLDLDVRAGEIVGLAGLRGSGRSQVARALFGAARVQAGEIRLLGKPVRWRGPRRAVKAGIAFVPSDRKEDGIFPRMSVADNLVPVALGKVSRAGFVVAPELRRLASRLVQDFRIRTAGLDQAMSRLSGGNQQKALLAKCLAVQPRFLIVDEPTQGIDVGAKAEIHALLRELAGRGVGILMVSSDLPEVLGMCDRIVVMAGGRVRAVLAGKDATEEQVMEFAAGRGAIA